jgi:adiponectin receptor
MAVSWLEHFRASEWRAFRALMFVCLGLAGVVPIVHGIGIHGYKYMEDKMSVSWVILHGAMYIFGAFLYAVSCDPTRSLGT